MTQQSQTIKRLVRNRIKEVREKQGMTQYALTKAIGRTHPYIKGVEAQQKQPGLDTLVRICMVLRVQPAELIYLDFEEADKRIKDALPF